MGMGGKTGMGAWPKNILHLIAKNLHRLKKLSYNDHVAQFFNS